MKITPAIETAGFGISGDIGGLARKTYWTPDGRVIRAIPGCVEFAIKDKDGNVIRTGTRDPNLDKGWLLSPPTVLKPFCRTCDRWHDTQEEVEACAVKQGKFIASMEAKVKQEDTDKVSSLEQRVAELTALVEKLMEGKGNVRQVLQRENPELGNNSQGGGFESPGARE